MATRWASGLHLHVAARRILDDAEAGTRLARGDLGPGILSQPFRVVRPPRAWMLLGAVEPRLQRGRLAIVGPVLVLDLVAGRVDHAGDVSRARQHIRDRAAEQPRADEYRFRGRDVIFLGAQLVDRQLHFTEIELDAADHHLPAGEL